MILVRDGLPLLEPYIQIKSEKMDTIIRKMKTYTLFDDWLLMILRYETGRIVLESAITVQCVSMD